MPEDIIIGFFVEATYSINGRSMISNDAILYAGVFKSSNKSKLESLVLPFTNNSKAIDLSSK